MIKSRTQKQSSLVQCLWQERANRTLAHLNHLSLLIDQFELMYEVSDRLNNETVPGLKKSYKEDTSEQSRKEKHKHGMDCKQFLELYQTFTIQDYDYWEYKNQPVFSLFTEKFEAQAQELEKKASELMLGIYFKHQRHEKGK